MKPVRIAILLATVVGLSPVAVLAADPPKNNTTTSGKEDSSRADKKGESGDSTKATPPRK